MICDNRDKSSKIEFEVEIKLKGTQIKGISGSDKRNFTLQAKHKKKNTLRKKKHKTKHTTRKNEHGNAFAKKVSDKRNMTKKY